MNEFEIVRLDLYKAMQHETKKYEKYYKTQNETSTDKGRKE